MAKHPEPHEHILTEDIMCPYCGWIPADSAEFIQPHRSGTAKCGAPDCGKTFVFSTDTTVEYTTERMPEHEPATD